jgi:mannose-6-phosphate isomerase-like protein (cupin superfamily)
MSEAVPAGGDAPPRVPHEFRDVGRDRLEMTHVHASPVIETERLEERS